MLNLCILHLYYTHPLFLFILVTAYNLASVLVLLIPASGGKMFVSHARGLEFEALWEGRGVCVGGGDILTLV